MPFEDLDKMLDQELTTDSNKDLEPENRKELLIVDDDKEVLEALHLVLCETYKVVLCSSGAEAIKAISLKTHAVILDIKMRVLDGFDTFLELKKVSPAVPIIFHSAYQDVKDPYEVINEFRPFGYIRKGGNDIELLDTIASAVHSYEQELELDALLEKVEKANQKLELIAKTKTVELRSIVDELRTIAISDAPPIPERGNGESNSTD